MKKLAKAVILAKFCEGRLTKCCERIRFWQNLAVDEMLQANILTRQSR